MAFGVPWLSPIRNTHHPWMVPNISKYVVSSPTRHVFWWVLNTKKLGLYYVSWICQLLNSAQLALVHYEDDIAIVNQVLLLGGIFWFFFIMLYVIMFYHVILWLLSVFIMFVLHILVLLCSSSSSVANLPRHVGSEPSQSSCHTLEAIVSDCIYSLGERAWRWLYYPT